MDRISPPPKAGRVIAGFALIGAWICWEGRDMAEAELGVTALATAFLVLMHHPVRWNPAASLPGARVWVASAALFLAGSLAGSILLQAMGWTFAWRAWTLRTVASSSLPVGRSWIAWFFLFPWITHDFPQVALWFRLTGAAACGEVFGGLGFPVVREGTRLLVGGLPVNIEAACAGMALLQALLVTGTVLALSFFPRSRLFYPALAMMPVLAWCANSARIAVITAVALSEGLEFSRGLFHTSGGLMVVAIMLALAVVLLASLRWAVNTLRR